MLFRSPADFLGLEADQAGLDARHWILFDPDHPWCWDRSSCPSLAANQPFWGESLNGAVVASGLSEPGDWTLPGGPWR